VLASREQIAEQLRRRGLRATGPRTSVYAAVEDLSGHPDVQAILARVHQGGDPVSTQAVYDSLAVLTAARLLRRIEPAGSPARYETRVGDNHHHIVCRICGATQDIDCAVGGAPCLEPASAGGFAVDEAEVTFWGLCPDCQRADATEATDPPAPNLKTSNAKTPVGGTTKQ
jgi:Fur family transcriptional regulator, stress-responsive regulator